MLSYPIEAAIKSGLFESVIVSTEDKEIAEVSLSVGAQVFERPARLAEDRSTVVQVCLNVLETLYDKKSLPDYFCCIYATALLITKDDLMKSFEYLHKYQADFVMGVTEYDLHPGLALEEKDGYLHPKWPEFFNLQSQFQPRLVASNGTIYWASIPVFLETKSFYGKKLKGYLMTRTSAVDIDTPDDFRIAKIIASEVLSDRSS